MEAAYEIETATGADVTNALPDVARLRIGVFRAFPYLYDGTEAHERQYLQTYVEKPGAAVILARVESRIVGAATCLPLAAETPNVQRPFLETGADVSKIFYFGESVLEAGFRGQGIGVAFFAAREAQARRCGATLVTFCAVQRPHDHPLRPQGYAPLDDFWHKRGFARTNLACTMSWRDVGAAQETEKRLVFWTKTL